MSKGRRYNGDSTHKLNIKKVIATIIAILVIIMFIIIVVKVVNTDQKTTGKGVTLAYYTTYQDGKWGVIDSKGKDIITPVYDEIIVIPNQEKDVFVVTYDVDYDNETYKSKAIDKNGKTLFSEYENVEAIQNRDSQNSVWYSTSCLKVEKDGLYGLIDFSGKLLLSCQYDSIEPLLNVKNTLITTKDSKKGLVSETGTVIINNEYEDITSLTSQYEDGYIVKNSEGKVGVIGTNKKTLVPVEYDKILNVKEENTYITKKENKLMIYDSEKNSETPISSDDVTSINNNKIIVENNGKFGIINNAGETVLEPKYQSLEYVFSDYYIAKENDKYGVINSQGETKLDFKYDSLTYRKDADFIEGNTSEKIDSDIINRNLEVKISGIISEVNVDKGYMKVRQGNEYKYYNFKFEEKKNTQILTNNTLFLSKKDGKYGYVNKDGVVVVNYIYDDATEQNDSGYAAIKKDGKWGAIDENGNIVVEPSLTLDNNTVINFIGTWHLSEDTNARYYTK